MALPAVAIGVGAGLLAAAPAVAGYFSKGQTAMRKDLASRVDSWKAGNKMVSDAERQDWMNTLAKSLPREQLQRVGRTTSGADTAALVGRSKDTDELRAQMFGTLIDKHKAVALQREQQLKADIKANAAETEAAVKAGADAAMTGASTGYAAETGMLDAVALQDLGVPEDVMAEIMKQRAAAATT